LTLGCAGGIVRPVSIRRWSVARIALIAVASMGILAGCVGVSPGATASVGSPNPTVADLAQIRAEIESQYAGQLLAIGEEATTVMVRFRSTAAASAAELLARYGSKVDISVGLFPYPAPSGSANGCAGIIGPLIDPGPLRATIELPSRTVGHDAAFMATVRLTNAGSRTMTVETGQPLTIVLYQPDGTIPVGLAAGAAGGTGLEFRLEPGASSSIPAAGGTSSCDLALGYELPDGPYVARAAVEIDRTDPSINAARGVFLSEPLSITVATP